MSLQDTSRFSMLPTVDIERSKFKRPHGLKTTFNAGELVPIFLDMDVLPGDTFSLDMSSLVRMSTPIFPTMDNAYLDTYFFFVPNRLLWKHWREFNGENSSGYWANTTEYRVPQLNVGSNYFSKGSLGDYFCLPTGDIGTYSVNHLPFRAYCLIWNEWFRDQNVMSPAYFTTEDSSFNTDDGALLPFDNESEFDWRIQNAIYGLCTLPVSKFHDYFTSCLPAPQKGEPISIFNVGDYIPVYALEDTHPIARENPKGLTFDYDSRLGTAQSSFFPLSARQTDGGYSAVGAVNEDSMSAGALPLHPNNLYAESIALANVTINTMRQAFQVQRLLEKDARGGTRYRELLKTHFGVDNEDARMQIPEYLGGKRIPINIDQVLQTSSTDSISPQGNTAGYSMTSDVSSTFTKSFTEHGIIIGLACVRTDHTYQQGIERCWSRSSRFDYYWPSLAHISEQPVYVQEILANARIIEDDNEAGFGASGTVFGYQEAWADYRYKPSHVTGAFRSEYARSLDSWHYADFYDRTGADDFVLSPEWLCETKVNIDRTLAVSSEIEDQFLADFHFDLECVRPMPLYSVPGLIDHF